MHRLARFNRVAIVAGRSGLAALALPPSTADAFGFAGALGRTITEP